METGWVLWEKGGSPGTELGAKNRAAGFRHQLGGQGLCHKALCGGGGGAGEEEGSLTPDSTQSAAPGEGRHRQSRVPTAGLSMETGGEKGR